MNVADSAAATFDSSITRLRAVDRFAIGRRALSVIAMGTLQADLQSEVLLPYFSAPAEQAQRLLRLRESLANAAETVEGATPALAGIFSNVLVPDVLQTPLLDQTILLASEVLRKLDSELALQTFGSWFNDRLDHIVSSGAVATAVGTPRALTELMISLSDLSSGESLYDPACGLGGTLAAAWACNPALRLRGVDLHPFSWAMSSLRLHLLGANAEVLLADALREDGESCLADRVVCDPPLGSYWAGDPDNLLDRAGGHEWRGKRLDSQFLDLAAHCLTQTGRGVIVVSQAVLSRRGPEQEMRMELVQSGLVEGVISLPAGAVPWTTADLALIILDRRTEPGDRIRFVDGSRMRVGGPNFRTGFDGAQLLEIYRSADHDRLVEVPRTDLSTDASLWPRAYFPSTDARLSVEEMLARAEQLEEEARSYTQRIRRLLRRVPAHPSD